MSAKFDILAATKDDLDAIAAVHRDARQVAMPWLPDIHTPEEDRWFFENIVFKENTLLIARVGEGILGFMAYKLDWLNHLYISPEHWHLGIGSALLKMAKETSPALQLWTFQRNTSARAFYLANGFVESELTDGLDNEEQEPDVRMEWSNP